MAKTSIKEGEILNAFKVVKKLDDKFWGCECIHCGKRRKFKKKKLLKYLDCDDCANTGDTSGFPVVISDEVEEDDDELDPKYLKKTEKDLKKNLASLFGDDSTRIQALLESAEKDKGIAKFQVSMVNTLIDLIPEAEAKYRDKGVANDLYAMNAMISQVRELINDMQANESQNDIASAVITKVIHPVFLSFGQYFIDEMFALKKSLQNDMKPEREKNASDAIDNSTRALCKGVEERYIRIQESMDKFFDK